MNPRPTLLSLVLLACQLAGGVLCAQVAYQSPYSVKFTFSAQDLTGDLDGARGEVKKQSDTPFASWYSPALERRFTSWGPSAQHFDLPAGIGQKSPDWMRQRVIAVAMRYVGYHYQHHHIPDWDPPQDWPYKSTPLGHQSKGLDCSNFTAWVYNLALGLKPSGETRAQSEMTDVPGPGKGRTAKVTKVTLPSSVEECKRVLKIGDLIFVKRTSSNEVSHVVMWVGEIGVSRNNVPLVIDSTGEGRKDETGAAIPDGVYLRPFTDRSWYFQSASHALRLIPEGSSSPK